MAAVTAAATSDEILADLRAATIPATRIFDIRQVRELPQLRDKLTTTTAPDGRQIHMQPLAVDNPGTATAMSFPPKYGADTRRLLSEAGYAATDVDGLIGAGVAA
jgi:crotonobetainyl-CoA:carnitine CoA-transferase CaiB-like acyl-CoA transferase